MFTSLAFGFHLHPECEFSFHITCLPGHLMCSVHTYTSGNGHAYITAVCGQRAFPHLCVWVSASVKAHRVFSVFTGPIQHITW